MAGDFNQWQCVGRLTRDPETTAFQNGGSVTKFSVATEGKLSRDKQTNAWVTEPLFMEVSAFNRSARDGEQRRGPGDIIQEYCRKGSKVFIVCKLILEKWVDKQTNQNRQAIKAELQRVVLLDGKRDGDGDGFGGGQQSGRGGYGDRSGNQGYGQDNPGGGDDEIPF